MRTHIVVPEELVQEVDELVGKRKRSRFFADAALEKLRRERLLRLAQRAAGSLKTKGPPEWETPEGTVASLREQQGLKSARERRLEEQWLPKPDPAEVERWRPYIEKWRSPQGD